MTSERQANLSLKGGPFLAPETLSNLFRLSAVGRLNLGVLQAANCEGGHPLSLVQAVTTGGITAPLDKVTDSNLLMLGPQVSAVITGRLEIGLVMHHPNVGEVAA